MGSEPLFLVMDQGGHASRALVLNESGEEVAAASVPVDTRRPRPGRVEHDAEALHATLRRAAENAVAALGPAAQGLRAAGLAVQRSSVVCWDRDTGRALSPVISWQDTRGLAIADELRALEPVIRDRSGLPLSCHFGAPKLAWCLRNLRAVRTKLREGSLAWGPLGSFLLFRLLQERPLLVDPTLAARTLLWSAREGDWDAKLLAIFGLPLAPLPRCVSGRHPFGTLAVAGRRVPLVVLSGDQEASLCACGMPRPDVVRVNAGTGAFVLRATDGGAALPQRLLATALDIQGLGRIRVVEGTVHGAGSALAALAAPRCPHVGDLQQALRADDEPPLFLNGVSGLGSPWWVADFPSRFIGDGDMPQKLAAVAESIVFLIAVNLQEMAAVLGPPSVIRIGGGLSAADGFCQRLADIAATPVVRAGPPEATARGLAWLVAGRQHEFAPDGGGCAFGPQPAGALEDRFRRWRQEMAAAVGRCPPRRSA